MSHCLLLIIIVKVFSSSTSSLVNFFIWNWMNVAKWMALSCFDFFVLFCAQNSIRKRLIICKRNVCNGKQTQSVFHAIIVILFDLWDFSFKIYERLTNETLNLPKKGFYIWIVVYFLFEKGDIFCKFYIFVKEQSEESFEHKRERERLVNTLRLF